MGLEEDVVAGIAFFKLVEHFGRQVIVDILRLPITVGQLETVDQRAINNNPSVSTNNYRVFWHQNPVKLSSTVFEQGLERRADSGFVGDTDGIETFKGFVVGFDRFMGWFD